MVLLKTDWEDFAAKESWLSWQMLILKTCMAQAGLGLSLFCHKATHQARPPRVRI
ncbi:MAG: hypothetical protein UX20_C0007G0010 [Candidatus Magasanikbacteria bacterium GW2011_GWC2_45_8]|uniref:Uncharacterized protein n=1 Tax=Candidatus Magasanikbacteria bacterium GW2011_GWC2_45_8 TaxID=1619050 RepID=A0A0G1N103_9BACT|nr:MAG: hypothetical protein UX20_C0007G0010 [Candidatus Magasanikbacteria bacterium GW2011_GWC2_45_8]